MALVVQGHELVGAQRELGVGLPVVVAELDFVNIGVKNLDYGAHFPARSLRAGRSSSRATVSSSLIGFVFIVGLV